MGRGNVCVFGKYEGLYYIDNDHIHVYRRDNDSDDYPETKLMGELSYDELTGGDWYYDEVGSMCELDDIEECISADFTARFRSFQRPQKECWHDRETRVLLESELFIIGLEDNEWSMAIKLLQKEDPYDNHLEGLQKRHHQRYLDALKEVLLDRLPSIGAYSGPWTSRTITREECAK